jgi:hypothetical protein
MIFKILENPNKKMFVSGDYNYIFNKMNGQFSRWGKLLCDDPDRAVFGPEILDLEISTGACLGRCSFCYKCNGTPINETKHMSLETFKEILDRMVTSVTVCLEDGTSIDIPAWEEVKLKDGRTKLAQDLCEGDIIDA